MACLAARLNAGVRCFVALPAQSDTVQGHGVCGTFLWVSEMLRRHAHRAHAPRTRLNSAKQAHRLVTLPTASSTCRRCLCTSLRPELAEHNALSEVLTTQLLRFVVSCDLCRWLQFVSCGRQSLSPSLILVLIFVPIVEASDRPACVLAMS